MVAHDGLLLLHGDGDDVVLAFLGSTRVTSTPSLLTETIGRTVLENAKTESAAGEEAGTLRARRKLSQSSSENWACGAGT